MVRRVNWSPAREPKGLEPPAPPRAPIRPPPLPRWIKINNIMNAPSGSSTKFNDQASNVHIANASLAGLWDSLVRSYYRTRQSTWKADFGQPHGNDRTATGRKIAPVNGQVQ